MILNIALGIAVVWAILALLAKVHYEAFRIEMHKEDVKNELAFQVAREKHLKQ